MGLLCGRMEATNITIATTKTNKASATRDMVLLAEVQGSKEPGLSFKNVMRK